MSYNRSPMKACVMQCFCVQFANIRHKLKQRRELSHTRHIQCCSDAAKRILCDSWTIHSQCVIANCWCRMMPIKFATCIKVHSCLNVLSAWPTSHLTSQHAAKLLYMPHLSLPKRKAMKQKPTNHRLTVSVCATYANCIEGPKVLQEVSYCHKLALCEARQMQQSALNARANIWKATIL